MFALIFVTPVIFALQSSSFKKFGLSCDNSKGSASLFSTIYLILSALVAVPFALMGGEFTAETAFYGMIFGAFFYGFIFTYSEALKTGPFAITSFLFSLSMIMPIIGSAIFFGESINAMQIVGFVLMIIAIYFINFAQTHSKEGKFEKKWIILCAVGFVCNGFLQFVLKMFTFKMPSGDISQFLLIAYIIGVLLSLIQFSFPSIRRDVAEVSINKWYIILALFVGLANFFGNYFLTWMGSLFDSQVLFPISNGTTVMLNVLCSFLLFKEKLYKRTILGIGIGIVSIVLLSI